MHIVVNCIEWHSIKFIQKVIKKAFFCPCKTHFISPSPCTPVKNVFYYFSLLKYRYEISIIDISTLLKNIDIYIDIDMEKLKISISISILIWWFLENIDIDIDIDKAIPKISISISILIWWFWKISISISISIRHFCKISISIKYRIDSNLAYRTGLVEQELYE